MKYKIYALSSGWVQKRKLNQLSHQTDTEQKFPWILIQTTFLFCCLAALLPVLAGLTCLRCCLLQAAPAADSVICWLDVAASAISMIRIGGSLLFSIIYQQRKAFWFFFLKYLLLLFASEFCWVVFYSITYFKWGQKPLAAEFSYAETGKGRDYAVHTVSSPSIPAPSALGWYPLRNRENPWNSQKWNNLFTKSGSF